MIAGTPVLDIKPYIPAYDSPETRTRVEPHDVNTHQSDASSVEESNISNLPNTPDTDTPSDLRGERTDCDSEHQVSEEKREADVPLTDSSPVSSQFSLHRVLEEVKAFVSQDDFCQSVEQVSDSPVKKSSESTGNRPCYGEEVYSTIADWIRAPPVASLEVHFTPRAEKELAAFLPSHVSGKTLV